MAFSKSIIVFLTFGLILSFVVEDTSGQHLRWGKRDELEADDPAAFINKGDCNLFLLCDLYIHDISLCTA